jgi:hypothetical protein
VPVFERYTRIAAYNLTKALLSSSAVGETDRRHNVFEYSIATDDFGYESCSLDHKGKFVTVIHCDLRAY